MSDEEGGGDVANPCVDWIVARIGDTRPASFKMAEVGKMKIDENSQCEPPPCMRPHNCREPAETLTRAAAQVRADRLRGRRGREARADLLGPEEQRPHRRPECAGHVRAPFVIPRDRFFRGAEKGAAHLRACRCRPPLPSPVTRCAILAQVQEEHKVDVVRQDVEVQAGVGG